MEKPITQSLGGNFYLASQRERFLFMSLALGLVLFCGSLVLLSPLKTLTLFIAFLLLLTALFRPVYLVFLLAFYLPFEPFLLKFVPEEIYVFVRYGSETLIYLLALVILGKILSQKIKIKRTPLDLPLILFLIVLIFSSLLNWVNPQVALLGIRQILRFIILFFVVVNLNLDQKTMRKIIYGVLAIVVFQGLLGVAQYLTAGALDSFLLPAEEKFLGGLLLTSGTEQFWVSGQRVFATLGRYDQLGTFLTFFSLIIIGLLYQTKNFQKRNRLFLILIVSLICLVFTYSRASWFGLILGLLLIGGIIKKDKKIIYGFLLLVIIFFTYLLASGLLVSHLTDQPRSTLTERFYEAFSYARWRGEYYGLGRLYFIVKTPLKVVAHSPFFGVGPGQYGGGAAASLHHTRAYDELGLPFGIFGSSGHIDNNWMSLWGETGTLGLAFYIWMLISLFIFSLRVYQKSQRPFTKGLALGFIGCLLAVSFQAFLGTYFEVRTLSFYLWLTAGLVVTSSYEEKIKPSCPEQNSSLLKIE